MRSWIPSLKGLFHSILILDILCPASFQDLFFGLLKLYLENGMILGFVSTTGVEALVNLFHHQITTFLLFKYSSHTTLVTKLWHCLLSIDFMLTQLVILYGQFYVYLLDFIYYDKYREFLASGYLPLTDMQQIFWMIKVK